MPAPQGFQQNGGGSCAVTGAVALSLAIIGHPNAIVKSLHDLDFLKVKLKLNSIDSIPEVEVTSEYKG